MSDTAKPKVSSIADLDDVDADTHLNEGFDLGTLLTYMDDQYRGIRESIDHSTLPHTEVFTQGLATPLIPFHGHDENRESTFAGPQNLSEKLDELEEFGIEYGSLNPSIQASISNVNNSRYAHALANAYNASVIDNYLDRTDRLKASILAAPHAPDKAAEEIDDRGDEDRIVIVVLPGTGLVPPPGHRWYDPIYDAAVRNGLNVGFHASGAASLKTFPVQYWWHETYAEDHALSHPFRSCGN